MMGDTDTDSSSDSKPRSVPMHLLEKFRALEKRVEDTTKRSTERRIKHLQKTSLENVAKALIHPDDNKIVNLPEEFKYDAPSPGSSVSNPGQRKRPAAVSDEGGEEKKMKESREEGEKEGDEERQWGKVRELLNVNDHLAGVSHGSLGPKTVLELKIEEAIAAGDFKRAEDLSDHMACREFGEKVAKAIDAKNFLEHKQQEEEAAKEKKKKKLHWGFEAKQRWETKSNM